MVPPASDRYGYLGNHYDIGNWYITPVVYDRAGWHLHQHLDNEFYQEWGDYLVTIRVPSGFLVGATGNLLNDPAADSSSENGSGRIHKSGEPDTDDLISWYFQAKKVHDFAWTTDPSYVLMQSEWNGITLKVLVLDYNRESWKQVCEWGLRGLQYLDETFGHYPYQQMTVADTYIRAGGIEYPQIVMLNDYINPEFEPGEFRALLLHEMAHNWFYGLLANNQTEQGWLDEGFATFAEIKAMEYLFGAKDNLIRARSGWIQQKTAYRDDDRRSTAYQYLRYAKSQFDRDPITIHSDYLGDNGYILQYSKMAMVLFMLEYTLGDSVFSRAMNQYFNQWSFRHPYGQDFIAVMEQTANRDLDWFFEQWLDTSRKLDYAIRSCKGHWEKIDSHRCYKCQVVLEKRAEIFMPINFCIKLEDGSVQRFHIPIDNYSQPPPDRISLPYWHFSQKLYTADMTLSSAARMVELDSILSLTDINSLNNTSSLLPPQEFHWMRYQSYAPPLDKYIWEMWPLLFYNDYDKIKAGIKLNGSYLNSDHKVISRLWFKTAHPAVDGEISYRTPWRVISENTLVKLYLFRMDGREGGSFGLSNQLSHSYLKSVEYEYGLTGHHVFNSAYLMAPWSEKGVSTLFFNFKTATRYRDGWKEKYKFTLFTHTSFLGSAFDFAQVYLEASRIFWDNQSGWEAILRFYTGYSEGRVPAQFLFNLGGDNGWEELNEPFYRSKGALPYSWRRNGHLYKAGGGNVRGSSLVGSPTLNADTKIIAGNLDLMIPNPLRHAALPLLRNLSTYVFADIGVVWSESFPGLSQFQKTAGVSLTLPAGQLLDFLFNLKQIRMDFPVWIGNTKDPEASVAYRWLITFSFE
jgi:aminopeptidase N